MSSWETKTSPSAKEDAMKLLAPTLAALALSAFSLAATATVTEADVLGHSVQLAAAQRTIVINAKTKWVNVKHGETVRFVAGGQEFTWAFDGKVPVEFLAARDEPDCLAVFHVDPLGFGIDDDGALCGRELRGVTEHVGLGHRGGGGEAEGGKRQCGQSRSEQFHGVLLSRRRRLRLPARHRPSRCDRQLPRERSGSGQTAGAGPGRRNSRRIPLRWPRTVSLRRASR